MNLSPDDLIEDALRTYPLAEPPAHFSQGVMQRIGPRAKSAPPMPRFRLTWMDCALGFFLALLTAVVLFTWACLPPMVLLQLEFQWQVLQVSRFLPALGLWLLAAAGLLFVAFLFSLNLLFQPREPLA